jgi:hypothetical protein
VRARACVRMPGSVGVCMRVTLLIPHATRMLHIVTSLVAPLASKLSHNGHNFRKKKKLLNMKCVFRFSVQLLSRTFLIICGI